MDPTNEIKSRLSLYLDGKLGFDEFHSAFADFLRTSREHDASAQELIWSVELAIASVGLGRWTRDEFRKELFRLSYVQYGVESGIASETVINDFRSLPEVALAGASVEIGPAPEHAR